MVRTAMWVLLGCLGAGEAWAQIDSPLAPEPLPTPRLTVYPTRARGGPNLRRFVRRMLETPLKAKFDIVPMNVYKRAGRKVRVRSKALGTPEGVKTAGEQAGVSHVLVVEGVRERQPRGIKPRNLFFAQVSLISVSLGETVFNQRYELQGRRMTPEVGDAIVFDISKALEPPPVAPVPEEEAAPPPPPEAPPLVEEPVAEAEPVPEEPVAPAPPPEETTPVAAADDTLILQTETDTVASDTYGAWRPGFEFTVGGLLLQREGKIQAGVNNPALEDPPCYCDRDGASNPFFPAVQANFELYPLAFGGTGAWYEGFGIHAEGFITQVKTNINDAQQNSSQVDSTVFSAGGGGQFRLVFYDSSTAPDFKVRVGYNYFQFPLARGAFPGVRYGSPYAGGTFTIPLGTDHAALVASGHYEFALQPSGKTKRLGTFSSGMAFRGEGGVRVSFEPFLVTLLFRFQQYETKYTGQTTLDNPNQYQDVTLTDQILGGFVSAGMTF